MNEIFTREMSTLISLIVRLFLSLKKYIEEHQQNDALVVPIDKKTNPWAEKGKCAIV